MKDQILETPPTFLCYPVYRRIGTLRLFRLGGYNRHRNHQKTRVRNALNVQGHHIGLAESRFIYLTRSINQTSECYESPKESTHDTRRLGLSAPSAREPQPVRPSPRLLEELSFSTGTTDTNSRNRIPNPQRIQTRQVQRQPQSHPGTGPQTNRPPTRQPSASRQIPARSPDPTPG